MNGAVDDDQQPTSVAIDIAEIHRRPLSQVEAIENG